MLDATAGNRIMWNHVNNNPKNIIFLDKETRLARPPHIFGDNTQCPFRDGVFDCVIYDPPHYVNAPPWFTDPTLTTHKVKNRPTFYGSFSSKKKMLSSVHRAQKEFQRIAKRLCLKWVERDFTIWKIMPFFREWKRTQILEMNKGRTKTYWITMVNSQFKENPDIYRGMEETTKKG